MPSVVCSYQSVAGLTTQYPYIVSSAANVSSAALAQFISDAQATVNARIAKRYTLPLTVESPLLTKLTTELAIIELCRKRIMFHFSKEDLSKAGILTRYDEVMKELDALANGEISLTTDVGTPVLAANMQFWSTTLGYQRTFYEGDQHLQRVDPDKLEHEYGERGYLS